MRFNIPLVAGLATAGLVLRQRRRRSRARLLAESLYDDRAGSKTLGFAALLGAGGVLLLDRRVRAEHTVHEWVELDVPVSTAYNQWTQFREFPTFMASVEEVWQLDDTHLHWKAVVAGKFKELDSEITEQIPHQRIAWRSTSGVGNSGAVTFHPLSDSRSRRVADAVPAGDVHRRTGGCCGRRQARHPRQRRFKLLVETRGKETGAWRGTVPAQ
jgi:uncharacterized membrane protein